MTDDAVRGQAEFCAFYAETFGALAAYACQQVRDGALADELAQEAMVRVFARWPLLRHPRTYGYRIVSNLVRDHVRTAQRERDAWDAVEPTYEPIADQALREDVDRLPERLRTVVLLHYFADLPLREVARVVRRPLGTVTRQVAEARRSLLEMHVEER